MRALIWRGEGDIRVEEVDDPVAEPGEVLLRVLAAGICGSDVGRFAGGGSRQPPPIVLGHEFVGEVVASAAGVGGPSIGERVAVHSLLSDGTCSPCRHGFQNLCRNRTLIGAHRAGAFAEYVVVPAATCHRLPADGAPEIGALVEPLACALHAIERGNVGSGDRLLVLGAGALGLLVAQAAAWVGVRGIIVSDPSPGRREAAIRLGADHAVDPEASDMLDQITRFSSGEGIDIVVDAFGSGGTRRQAVDFAAPGGRAVLLGLHDGVLDMPGTSIVLNELSLLGTFGYAQASFTEAAAKAGQGLLDPFVRECQVRPLSEGAAAFAELAKGAVDAPRVILVP